jgi:hypothetical protein
MSEPKNNARNAFNASGLHRPSMAYTLHDEMVQGPSECRERGNNQRCQKKAQPVTIHRLDPRKIKGPPPVAEVQQPLLSVMGEPPLPRISKASRWPIVDFHA